MNRPASRRPLLACLALLALAACVVNVDFTYTETAQAIQQTLTGDAIDATITVDLSAQPDIAAHAASVESLQITSLGLTVSAVQGDNSVETVTGTLSLRPSTATDSSQDVLVGQLAAFPIAVGSSVQFPESAAVDAFALAAVKGPASFIAVISGTTTGGETADFAVDVALSVSMGYDAD